MSTRLFIGSSTEGLLVAHALHEALTDDAEVTIWSQGVVEASQYILEGLLAELDQSDLGIFVFTPDDVAKIREIEKHIIRDNVLFELGLFIGRLGRKHSFFIVPKGVNLHIPSDLSGILSLTYDPSRIDGRILAAIGPAANKVRRIIQEFEKTKIQNKNADGAGIPEDFSINYFQRRALLSSTQILLLKVFEDSPMRSFKLDALMNLFRNQASAELYYRLEQLRLLGFVSRMQEAGEEAYKLADSYVAALKSITSRRHDSPIFRMLPKMRDAGDYTPIPKDPRDV